MEKQINHKISIRLKPTLTLPTNQLTSSSYSAQTTEGSPLSSTTLQIDRIYDKRTTNQMLAQILFPSAQMHRLETSLLVLVGAVGSGKDYTLMNTSRNTGEQQQKDHSLGLVLQLYSKIKAYCSCEGVQAAIRLRVVEQANGKANNLGWMLMQKHQASAPLKQPQSYQLLVGSAEELLSLMGRIGNIKSKCSNLLIEMNVNILQQNSTCNHRISFLALSPQRVGQKQQGNSQLGNRLIKVFEQLPHIRQLPPGKQKKYFSCVLLRALKPTLLNLKRWEWMGLVDAEQWQQSEKTVQFLTSVREKKSDKVLIAEMREEIDRQEAIYEELTDTHGGIIRTLAKFVDMAAIKKQCGGLVDLTWSKDRQGSTHCKHYSKVQLNRAKKKQKEQEIQQLRREIARVERETAQMEQSHLKQMERYEQQLGQAQQQGLNKEKIFKQLSNPSIKCDNKTTSIYWRPPKENLHDKEFERFGSKCSFEPKQPIKSNKNFSNIQRPKSKKKTTLLPDCVPQQSVGQVQIVRQGELSREIKQIFMLIAQQEQLLECSLESGSSVLDNKLVNRIKNRKNGLKVNEAVLRECLRSEASLEDYLSWIGAEQAFERYQHEMRQKVNIQTVTTIKELP